MNAIVKACHTHCPLCENMEAHLKNHLYTVIMAWMTSMTPVLIMNYECSVWVEKNSAKSFVWDHQLAPSLPRGLLCLCQIGFDRKGWAFPVRESQLIPICQWAGTLHFMWRPPGCHPLAGTLCPLDPLDHWSLTRTTKLDALRLEPSARTINLPEWHH